MRHPIYHLAAPVLRGKSRTLNWITNRGGENTGEQSPPHLYPELVQLRHLTKGWRAGIPGASAHLTLAFKHSRAFLKSYMILKGQFDRLGLIRGILAEVRRFNLT